MSRFTGPFVIAQGDFAPWNIRVHPQGIFVFDWEYARTGANALADVLNYFMIQRAVSRREISKRYLATAMRRAADTARELYPERMWQAREVSGLALAYMLEVLLCYSRSRECIYWTHPVIQSYWRLVERRSEWMAE